MKTQLKTEKPNRCVYYRDKVSYIYCSDKGYWNSNGLFVEGTDAATGYRYEKDLMAEVNNLVHSDYTNGKISIVTFFSEATSYSSMIVQPVTVLPRQKKQGVNNGVH